MAKTNTLGNFIRNRRQELSILGGVSGLSRELGCSVGYLSRVERGNADGPSIKFLQEAAKVLKVDVKHLIQMKEQDGSAERDDKGNGTNMDGEQGKISAGSTMRQFAAVAAGHQKEQTLQSSQLDVDRLSLRADLDTLAKMHLGVAEKLLDKGYTAEALAEQRQALITFERLTDAAGIAFSCFNHGRVYRRLAFDQAASPVERIQFQQEAGDWFERSYTTFTENLDKLSEEYLGRRTECLVQWARTDELTGWLMARLNDDDNGAFPVLEAQTAMRSAVATFYSTRAREKRLEALSQYEAYISRLLAKDKEGADKKEGTDEWEHIIFLLAETHHRIGVVCRDLAHVETNSQLGSQYRSQGIDAFFKALEHRRELVKAFPGDQTRISKYLDRLANTHSEFGNSLQLQQDDSGADEADMREEAYWQFKVAWKLYDILGMVSDEPSIEYVSDHILGIQQDEGRHSDIISRQRVEELLTASDFGTVKKPSFEYPMTARLDAKKAVC